MFAASSQTAEHGPPMGVGCGGARVRRLARGETLFHTGDARDQLYRVERGALCHYLRWEDGHHEVIEFAFPGDIVGFGHLAMHTSTAQAAAKTIVSPVSEEEFEQLLETDGQLAARYAAAGDREFEFMRVRAIEGARGQPAKRVASFLAALSRLGGHEGRDPNVITEEFSSGAVAEHLNMSVDALAGVLRELEAHGIVSAADDGLRIADVDALEKFADAA
jgi:CRP/FNR family transcriptional regulator